MSWCRKFCLFSLGWVLCRTGASSSILWSAWGGPLCCSYSVWRHSFHCHFGWLSALILTRTRYVSAVPQFTINKLHWHCVLDTILPDEFSGFISTWTHSVWTPTLISERLHSTGTSNSVLRWFLVHFIDSLNGVIISWARSSSCFAQAWISESLSSAYPVRWLFSHVGIHKFSILGLIRTWSWDLSHPSPFWLFRILHGHVILWPSTSGWG